MARYNESRSAVLVNWHPTRREILISTRFGDVVQLHRVAKPGCDRQQLTFFPDRVAGCHFNPATKRPRWRPTGHELGFSLSSAGTPGDTYSNNLDTKQFDGWRFSETGGIQRYLLGEK